MEHNQRPRLHLSTASNNFDLSDLKTDKTQYLDRTQSKSNPNSPFEPKEISARSTHIQSHSKMAKLDFDEIMKNSVSEAVRNKYRESLAVGRLSQYPRISEASSRASINSKATENNRTTSTSHRNDFWDEAQPSFSSFTGKNLTYSNEEFIPAENMTEQLNEDEKMQEMEYAVIPKVTKVPDQTLNWESSTVARQPEMSFGQYCMEKVKQNDIRDIYNAASPPKRQDRIPLVEVTCNESALSMDNLMDSKTVEKLIKKCDTVQAENIFFKKGIQKDFNKTKSAFADIPLTENSYFRNSIAKMMDELDVNKIMEQAEKEKRRSRSEKENTRVTNDNVPVQDEEMDDLQRYRNELTVPNRGVKRRTTLTSSDTPKSALDKCLRSRSPTHQKEMEIAAARLKPNIINDDDVFKRPLPFNSWDSKSNHKSPSRTFVHNESQQAENSSREYLSAMQSLSLRGQDEKLSLPNYTLQRPVRATTTSPTSSVRSMNARWSPECGLKRSVSQLSNESEFSDDFLPIKINNIDNRKISFPSVKIDKSITKSISIQNGSSKKLPLRVKVIGAGFSVTPQEEFRMIPMEARTFNVKFTPSVIGPARGCLIFELTTNKQCSQTIPLYGYGGHSSISIENVQKGPYGPAFITMGTVKDLTGPIEQEIKLFNKGTLPSFVTLAFERTKLSDFALSNSITMEPTKLRIEPGKSADVKIRFKATRMEIKKIISINKDVATIGEICVISGDEPTRIRVLKNQHFVEPKFLEYLPKSLPNEVEIQTKVQNFKEDLSREKLTEFIQQFKTQEIALTINRNLEDTIVQAEISLADDTRMSYKTFNNQTNIPSAMDTLYSMDDEDDSLEFLESKYFRITPSELIFKRSTDFATTKVIRIESLCNDVLYVEAVPSNQKLVSALRSCGKLAPRDSCEIKVSVTQRAFQYPNSINCFIALVIHDARIEIPVKIID